MAEQSNIPAELLQAIQRGEARVVDLTHTLGPQAPFWREGNAPSPFHAKDTATYRRDSYFGREIQIPEHSATHMDAPRHFDPAGKSIDQLAVENFLTMAVVVDVSAAVRSNPDYRVTVADLENWEKAHGPMPRGCLVLLNTGWASRWPSEKQFMNQDAEGVRHFPGYSLGAAHYLLEHVHPVGLGIDTSSIDYGPSKDFEVHRLTMFAGLYHLENVVHLEELPPTGAAVIALPLKLEGGSGSPARVLALVPNEPPARR
ncbi:MAG: cyclase family protein [Acidobacteriia bacterium]|nr:cyclase family protein [Terriglobia bacterium]